VQAAKQVGLRYAIFRERGEKEVIIGVGEPFSAELIDSIF
jgi:hypothetical protein